MLQCTYLWFTFHAGKIRELRDVLNELSTLNQWYHFGIYLGLDWSTLDAIKKDYVDTKECRVQMLIEWQKRAIPTWSAVVKALVGIGRERLASHLATEYGMLYLCVSIYRYLLLALPSCMHHPIGVRLPNTVDNKPLEQLDFAETKQKMVR